MLRILKSYRDQEDPDMGLIEDKPYETLSKKECLDLLQKFSIDGLELCRLGHINPVLRRTSVPRIQG